MRRVSRTAYLSYSLDYFYIWYIDEASGHFLRRYCVTFRRKGNFLLSKHRRRHGRADNSFFQPTEISFARQGRGSCTLQWRSCSPTTSGFESKTAFSSSGERCDREYSDKRYFTSERTGILRLLFNTCFAFQYIDLIHRNDRGERPRSKWHVNLARDKMLLVSMRADFTRSCWLGRKRDSSVVHLSLLLWNRQCYSLNHKDKFHES